MKHPVCTLLSLIISCGLPAAAHELSWGGFIKADAKVAHGNLPFKSIWDGNPGTVGPTQNHTQFSAQESRLNLNYDHLGLHAFVEMDFAASYQGNPLVSNSYSPRLRHAFMQYQGVTLGQTWSTLVNPSSFPESANLGGALVGEAMVRQAQARLTLGNWQMALENPAWLLRDYDKGSAAAEDQALPDVIVKYSQKGDWGNVSIAGLGRSLPIDESQSLVFGASAAGVVLLNPQNELKWQLHYGHLGRYIGTTAAADVFDNQAEKSLGGMLSLRHHFSPSTRSSLYGGYLASDIEHNHRGHIALNLFHDPLPNLSVGIELGHYMARDEANAYRPGTRGESTYLHLTSVMTF